MRLRGGILGNTDSDRAGLGTGLGGGSSTGVLRTIGKIVGEYNAGGVKRMPVCNNGRAVGLDTNGSGILW